MSAENELNDEIEMRCSSVCVYDWVHSVEAVLSLGGGTSWVLSADSKYYYAHSSVLQLCFAESNGSDAKNLSDSSKSELNETKRRVTKRGSVETGALAIFFCLFALNASN